MEKDHHESPVKFLLKKVVKILPASLPAKIYNLASHMPPLKQIANVAIRSTIPKSITIDEGVILLNQKDVAVSGSLALGMFEKKELAVFRNSIKNGHIVADIGANIGLYTVIAARKVGPIGKVFSFEPEAENFDLLSKNVELNKFENTTLINSALSDTSGERDLYLSKDNKGHYSFSDDSFADTKISVKTNTFDEYMKKYGSPKIDLIKMDIEGAEPLALDGMKETIKRNSEIIIFTEIYPKAMKRLGKDPLEFLRTLDSFDLSVWVINEGKDKMEKIESHDFESFIANFPRGESFKNLYVARRI